MESGRIIIIRECIVARSRTMPKAVKLMVLVVLSVFAPVSSVLFAWGPVSHIALTYESGVKSGFPVSSDLLGAYLAGATEPDIGLDDGKSEDYGVYHSEEFARAMESVAANKKSPDRELLLARAAGIRSHLAGDSSAHGANGYSDNKKMFAGLPTGLPVHTTNELCADLIMYDRNKTALKNQSLNFLDVDTLMEVRTAYSKATGKELNNDREKLKKEVFNHRALILTELSLANHLGTSDPDKLAQMRAEYSDLDAGVAGGKGAELAKTRIAEQAKTREDLSSFKTTNKGAKIKDFLGNSLLAKSFQALERGVLKLTRSAPIRDKALDFAEGKVSSERNKAFVNFGINLLNKNISFKQAMVLAGKNVSGYPENTDQKLAYLEIEAEALKAQRDKALEEYNNRPWWKFWLIFTQSDKKKYQQLETDYQKKLQEITSLRASIYAENPETALELADTADLVDNASAPACSSASADLSKLQAAVDAAYKKYTEAAAGQSAELTRAAAAELAEAKAALNAARP